jgi:hypothetical protein
LKAALGRPSVATLGPLSGHKTASELKTRSLISLLPNCKARPYTSAQPKLELNSQEGGQKAPSLASLLTRNGPGERLSGPERDLRRGSKVPSRTRRLPNRKKKLAQPRFHWQLDPNFDGAGDSEGVALARGSESESKPTSTLEARPRRIPARALPGQVPLVHWQCHGPRPGHNLRMRP